MQSADFEIQNPLMDGEEEEFVPIVTYHRRLENHDEQPAEDIVTPSEKTSSKELVLPRPPRFEIYKHSEELHDGIVRLPSVVEVDDLTTLRIFSMFLNDRMLDCIVKNTNDYARVHKAGEKGSRPWKDIDRNDLVVWIAIVIYQSVHREPAVSQYWSQDPTAPIHPISKHMGLSRFQQIKRYIHVSPWDASDEHYYNKVEPLMSHIRNISKKLYVPKSNVAIDEMMVQFSGRSAHTVKIKNKPIPQGYKILSLCDDGYTYTFLPTSRINKADTEDAEGVNYTGRLVIDLVKQLSYQVRAFNLYVDNYFTSFGLFHHLRLLGVGACGTARKTVVTSVIKLPQNSKLDWDTRSGAVKNDVLAFFWQDNGPVTMLTTIHEVVGEEWEVLKNRKRPRSTSTNSTKVCAVFGNSSRKELKIPKILDDYNCNMNAVDIADQLRSYYSTHQPTRRNWMPLFFWLLDTAIVNSYLLIKKKGSILESKDFRHKLAWEVIRSTKDNNNLRSYEEEELVEPPAKKTKVTKTFVLTDERFEGSGHFPEWNAQRSPCRWCSYQIHRTPTEPEDNKEVPRSNLWCKRCKVPLCVNKRSCFADYHEKQ